MTEINNKLWEQLLAEIELEISKADFLSFFSTSKLIKNKNNTVFITCRNIAEKKMLEQRYAPLIERLIKEKLNKKTKAIFKIIPNKEIGEDKNFGPLFSSSINSSGLDPLSTMENFAVSSSNQLAYAAAQAVVDRPGRAYNPLFLWGGVGVGKTHLAQAVGHELLKKDPNTRIIFCTGEEFTNEIIEAIKNKTTGLFKKKYRSAQLLLLDDIQFIAGKIKVQEEFFHTFATVKRAGGQIILTSDKPPHEILELEARLRSRFEAGLIADISHPNFELRTAIVLIKARQRGKSIPMDVARLLAEKINDARRIEGALMRLITESEIKGEELNIIFAEKILGNISINAKRRPPVSTSEIIKKVSSYFGITLSDLRSKKRSRPIAIPRQITMYLLREEIGMSLQDIGSFLGGRDHTTIMYGVNKIKNMMLKDSQWNGDILGIKREIWGKYN